MQRSARVGLEATHSRGRRGFTLIELLVVVSIIALLISILMPSLRRARAQAKTVVCRSNIRQVGMGALYYAHDYHDQLFPAAIDAGTEFPDIGGAWARLYGPHNIVEPGLLYPYVYHMDAVVECPTNGRRTTYSNSGPNMFGGDTALDFDYTMIGNTQGARTSGKTQMAYLAKPQQYGIWAPPPISMTSRRVIRLQSLAIFVEEHTKFWNEAKNEGRDDGLWGNADQISIRHNGGGNIAFLDGSVALFKPPIGARDDVYEPEDLDANDLYVRTTRDGLWTRLEQESGVFRPYGWVNDPVP